MFTTYMTDYMPAIMKEINSLYDVDGLFTNAWPPLGSLPVCHCEQCRTLPPPGTIAYWERFNERTIYPVEAVRLASPKRRSPSNFYLRESRRRRPHRRANLVELGEVCEWFQCDNQGRGGDDTPIWGCALQGRVCNAVQSGKMATNVTGAWSTGAARWRNVHKSPEEARMWMNETLASGMVPYHHIVGGETGLGEDRRSARAGAAVLQLDGEARAALRQQPVDRDHRRRDGPADAAVPHVRRAGPLMQQYIDGLYYALLEGRFLFDFVHEEKLSAERPGEVLGAAAAEHRAPERRAVPPDRARTSRPADRCWRRSRPASTTSATSGGRISASADVFGIRKAGDIVGTTGNAYMARIERRHDILNGFDGTTVDPWRRESRADRSSGRSGAHRRAGLRRLPAGAVVSGSRRARTSRPSWCARAAEAAWSYFPGDIERTMWKSGHTDLARLLQNAIRWVAGANPPVTIQGDGVIEAFAWETSGGLCRARAELHEPGDAPGLAPRVLSDRRAARTADGAAESARSPGSNCCRRRRTCRSKSQEGPCRSRSPLSRTTKSPRSIRRSVPPAGLKARRHRIVVGRGLQTPPGRA